MRDGLRNGRQRGDAWLVVTRQNTEVARGVRPWRLVVSRQRAQESRCGLW